MPRYMIEDTAEGYRLSLLRAQGTPFISVEETGGHGKLESLFVQVEQTWEAALAEARNHAS